MKNVKTVKRAGDTFKEKIYLPAIFQGMKTTLRHFMRNLLNTQNIIDREYPEHQPYIPERWRGRHRLMAHEDGTIKCVACFMCATNCPAECIQIVATERMDGVTEKMPETFTIDLLECVYCGFCVEACPVDAIRMDTRIFAVTKSSREGMVLGIDELLNNGSGEK